MTMVAALPAPAMTVPTLADALMLPRVQVQWMAPTPLWGSTKADPPRMQRPALLRFDSDTFMEDLARLLHTDPAALGGLLAQPESFRAPPVGAEPDWTPTLAGLKLYQPIHGHFYLVAASLVCRLTGLPDRVLDTASGERVGFVLRRVVAARSGQDTVTTELAWVDDPTAGKGWRLLPADRLRILAPAEELLPLFPVTYADPRAGGQRRRLLAGLVPTTSRDSFQADAALSPIEPARDPQTGALLDPRVDDADSRVVEPLRALKAQPSSTAALPGETEDERRQRLDATELQQQEASRFLLLDFADFLKAALPGVWDALYRGHAPRLADAGASLIRLLATQSVESAAAPTWQQALRTAWDERDRVTGEDPNATPSSLTWNLQRTALDPTVLRTRLGEALRASPLPDPPAVVPAAASAARQVPKLDPRPGARYVLRCVFQQPACGPLRPDLLSEPTEAFELASFFDPDAPGRPIRISLPVDTSVAGLRKFNKNVAFLISDQLRAQMARATDLKKALDGNLGSGETFDLGLICSFSLPIITICALLVLMIFINLLNIVFWWLPFLRICLPLGLVARRSGR